MELILNISWAFVAAWLVCAWLRWEPRRVSGGRAQFVALAVVILILLPAISMTDDLVAAQNPAEIECCARRDHDFASSHAITPTAAALPPPAFSGLLIQVVRMDAPPLPATPFVEDPALNSVQNRPPPAV